MSNATQPALGLPKRDAMQRTQRRRKGVVLGIALAAGAAMLVSASRWRAGAPVHEAIEYTGIALIAVCVLGRVWCSLYLGGRKKREVVRVGPYSLVRNPLYVFSLVGVAGIGLCAGSVAMAVGLTLPLWAVFDALVRSEERYLSSRFGEEYVAYLRDTPRWLPSLGSWRSVEWLEIKPNLAWRTLRDASLFVLALPALEAVEAMQTHHVLPVLLRLP